MATSLLNAKFVYYSEHVTIATTNDTITFTEGGGNLTATLTPGTYFWGELCPDIKRALQAVGSGNYEVSYDHATRKYTITKSAGTFTLDVGVTGDDALPTLGFTVDCSAALTYTSDTAVPSTTTLTLTSSIHSRIQRPQPENEVDREDARTENGRQVSTYHGDVDRFEFLLEYLSVTDTQGLRDMWDQAGKFGNAIDFYPDSGSSDYVTVYWDTKVFRPPELIDRNLYRLYAIEVPFRFKVPAGGTITARGLIDRGPS